MEGAIGLELTNKLLEETLHAAKLPKPAAVILEIDSPGGSLAELRPMLKTVSKYAKLSLIHI